MTKQKLAEADMVATVAEWFDKIKIGDQRAIMRQQLKAHIRASKITVEATIKSALAGHADADMALRELASEMMQQDQPVPAKLRDFAAAALVRPPMTYPRGYKLADSWVRDILICTIVKIAMETWPIKKSRGTGKGPSACSLVSEALKRNGTNLSEKQVARIFEAQGTLPQRMENADI